MIFDARQPQEKCQKKKKVDLYTAFMDSTKTFNTVNHEGLWKIMSKFGCPERLICIECHFHNCIVYLMMEIYLPSNKHSEARMCACPHTVQHDVSCSADRRLSGH